MSLALTIQSITFFRYDELLVEKATKANKSSEAKEIYPILKITGLMGIACFLIIFLIAALGSTFFNIERYKTPFILFGLITSSSFISSSWASILKGFQKFKQIALFNALEKICIFFLLLAFFDSLNVNLVIALETAIILSFLIIKFLQVVKVLNISFTLLIKGTVQAPLKNLLIDQNTFKYLKFSFFTSCLSSIVKQGDIYILSLVSSSYEVSGLFKVAKSLSAFIQNGSTSLEHVMFRDLCELKHLRKEFPAYIKKILKLWIPVALVVLTTIFSLSSEIITFTYGQEFENATGFLRILLVGVGIAMLFTWVRPLVFSLKKPQFDFYTNCVTFMLYYIVIFLGWHRWEEHAFAIALSLAWAVGYLSNFFLLFQSLKKGR